MSDSVQTLFSLPHFGVVEVPSLASSSSLCFALFCIFESFACKPCFLLLPALWKGGDESPTPVVLMSKLEQRRFETQFVFCLKIKPYISIAAVVSVERLEIV